MCTLLVAHRHYPGRPLVVAANRDEQLDRASGRPRAWTDRPLPLFAPEDLRAGGTWLGINGAGVFAALTNRYAGAENPGGISPDRRSRGLLVLDALEEPTAREAFDRLATMSGELHNPFHLAVADGTDAFLIWSDGWRLHATELPPGLHAITERSFDAAPSGREDAFRGWTPSFEELRPALAVHRDSPLSSTCVHGEAFNYGTKSATWIEYDGSGPARFEFADGPSCTTPWEDLSDALTRSLSEQASATR
jgi:hypothetical protein